MLFLVCAGRGGAGRGGVGSVGHLPAALNILLSLGFREGEGGNLQMPLDANVLELEARKLELEVGELLRVSEWVSE